MSASMVIRTFFKDTVESMRARPAYWLARAACMVFAVAAINFVIGSPSDIGDVIAGFCGLTVADYIYSRKYPEDSSAIWQYQSANRR